MADELEVHTTDEVLAFQFVCPRCGAVIAVMCRVVLTPDRCFGAITCDGCGNTFHLALMPPTDD